MYIYTNPGKLNIKTFEKDVNKFSLKIMIQAHFGPQCKGFLFISNLYTYIYIYLD